MINNDIMNVAEGEKFQDFFLLNSANSKFQVSLRQFTLLPKCLKSLLNIVRILNELLPRITFSINLLNHNKEFNIDNSFYYYYYY